MSCLKLKNKKSERALLNFNMLFKRWVLILFALTLLIPIISQAEAYDIISNGLKLLDVCKEAQISESSVLAQT